MVLTNKIRLGPRYDDLPPVPITAARLGATAPTLATFKTDIEQYTFDATNDYVIGAFEIVHGVKENTDMEFHVHWATNGSEGADRYVNFQVKYSICIPLAAAGAQQTITTGDLLIASGTADRTHYVSDFSAVVSGAGIVIGTYIVFRFERIAAVGTAPAADPFVLAVGIHAKFDTLGSVTEYLKG